MSEKEAGRICVACLVVGVIVGIIVGFLGTNSAWKKSAIKHKAGQYVIFDKTSGMTEFKWNDEIKEK